MNGTIDDVLHRIESIRDAIGIESPRVLIVDDDAGTREFIAAIFRVKRSHYILDFAATAAEAEKILRSRKYAGAIIDHWLPGECGIDLMARLRKDGVRVPWFLISGEAHEETRNGMHEDANRHGVGKVYWKGRPETKWFTIPETMRAMIEALAERGAKAVAVILTMLKVF
jgi:CheY-like chemotaxis protein